MRPVGNGRSPGAQAADLAGNRVEKGEPLAEPVLRDEFHLSVFVPRELPGPAYEAMRRALDGDRFQARLARAARKVFRHHPALRRAHVTLTR
jgi:hypothetical protein